MAMEFLVKGKITYTNQYFCLHKKKPAPIFIPQRQENINLFCTLTVSIITILEFSAC